MARYRSRYSRRRGFVGRRSTPRRGRRRSVNRSYRVSRGGIRL